MREKKTTPERKQELYDLYLRRHDRINNWDLVDLAAWYVVGPHLVDKPHDVLYKLARSKNMWERRTAILATFSFIKRGDPTDTFAIAEILLDDPEDLIHKAVGGMLRAVDNKNLPGAHRLPRQARRDHAPHHAALRHRALRQGSEGQVSRQ